MLMIYSFFNSATITVKSRSNSALKVLLPLSFGVLLLGCDSHSSSPTPDKKMISTPINDSKQNADISAKPNNTSDLESDLADSIEGESLINAAKSDRKSATNSLNDSQLASSNKMQATLIGDYTGIMPCDFCDSTQVLLNLFADGSVVKNSVYNNPQKPTASLTENGIYRQDNDTITIVYDDQRIENYVIENNHLVLLDEDKIADIDYTLSRK